MSFYFVAYQISREDDTLYATNIIYIDITEYSGSEYGKVFETFYKAISRTENAKTMLKYYLKEDEDLLGEVAYKKFCEKIRITNISKL